MPSLLKDEIYAATGIELYVDLLNHPSDIDEGNNLIIDEIRDCGFGVGATYSPPNEYEIMINNLKDSYNDRAYIRKAISIYRDNGKAER